MYDIDTKIKEDIRQLFDYAMRVTLIEEACLREGASVMEKRIQADIIKECVFTPKQKKKFIKEYIKEARILDFNKAKKRKDAKSKKLKKEPSFDDSIRSLEAKSKKMYDRTINDVQKALKDIEELKRSNKAGRKNLKKTSGKIKKVEQTSKGSLNDIETRNQKIIDRNTPKPAKFGAKSKVAIGAVALTALAYGAYKKYKDKDKKKAVDMAIKKVREVSDKVNRKNLHSELEKWQERKAELIKDEIKKKKDQFVKKVEGR